MDDRHEDTARPGVPAVLALQPLQPAPLNCQVYHSGHGDGCQTDIARVFRAEDARFCRLCERCTATVSDDGRTVLCLVHYDGHVPLEDAELFRDPGLREAARPRLVSFDFRPGAGAPA